MGFFNRLPSSLTHLEIWARPLYRLEEEQIQTICRTVPQVEHLTLEAAWSFERFNRVLEALLPPDTRPPQITLFPSLRTFSLLGTRRRNDYVPRLAYYLTAMVKRRRGWMDMPDLRVEVDSEVRWAMEDMNDSRLRVLMNDGFALEVWEMNKLVRYWWPLPQDPRRWM